MERVERALERVQECWERYSGAGAGSRDGAEVLGAVESLRRTAELLPGALLAPAAALLFADADALPGLVARTLAPGTAPGWAAVAPQCRAAVLALAAAIVAQLASASSSTAQGTSPLLVHRAAPHRHRRACVRALAACFAPLRATALAVLRRDTAAATRVLALELLDTLYNSHLPFAAGTAAVPCTFGSDEDLGEEECDDCDDESENEERSVEEEGEDGTR